MYEDKLLLKIRIDRLKGKTTYSQSPRSRCHHVLQMPQVDERDDNKRHYVTWTPLHYIESRADQQTLYAAWATHHLTLVDDALRIRLKRVALVNCDAALGGIKLFARAGSDGQAALCRPRRRRTGHDPLSALFDQHRALVG